MNVYCARAGYETVKLYIYMERWNLWDSVWFIGWHAQQDRRWQRQKHSRLQRSRDKEKWKLETQLSAKGKDKVKERKKKRRNRQELYFCQEKLQGRQKSALASCLLSQVTYLTREKKNWMENKAKQSLPLLKICTLSLRWVWLEVNWPLFFAALTFDSMQQNSGCDCKTGWRSEIC